MSSWYTFLQTYPKIYLSFASFFLIIALRRAVNHHRQSKLPTNWPLFGMLPALAENLFRLHDWIAQLATLCGGNFFFHCPWFLSMEMFVTADPANVGHICNTAFGNFPKSSAEICDIFDFLGDGIFTASDDSRNAQSRAVQSIIASESYHSFVLHSTKEKVDKNLYQMLNATAEWGEEIDLQEVFQRFALDAMSRIVFGVDPGCLYPSFPIIPIASAMNDIMRAISVRNIAPSFLWKTLRKLRLGPERKLAAARCTIDDFITQTIKTKQENCTESFSSSCDLLSIFTNNPPEDIRELLSDKFLRDTTVNFLFAARDTTSAALTWLFWLLTQNREAENKIIEELESCSKTKGDIEQLVYLHAAVCEALRLYPPVPFEHRAVLKPETLPSEHEVKPGMMILMSTYAMGRMEGVWGKDCSEFKPERWISESGTLKHELMLKFFSFSTGPRSCLGKDLVFKQMKIVAAALVPRFYIEVLQGHVVEPKVISIALQMKNGLMVKVSKRRDVVPRQR